LLEAISVGRTAAALIALEAPGNAPKRAITVPDQVARASHLLVATSHASRRADHGRARSLPASDSATAGAARAAGAVVNRSTLVQPF
jgi:hypothetical protein